MVKQINIKSISVAEWPAKIKALGLKPYTAGQLIQWFYQKGATSFDEMTNISKDARKILLENFYVSRLTLVNTLTSEDGTKKFAWQLEDGNIIESVLIPAEPCSKIPLHLKTREPTNPQTHELVARQRLTLCISTQVGCTMGCSFCRTGDMGFVRNLDQSEIVDQILEAQHVIASLRLSKAKQSPESNCKNGIASGLRPRNDIQRISNVVLMGMGEPLANYENVVNALRIMIDQKCLNLSKRHVTISTCGLVPEIERFAKEGLGIKLAISLNATTDESRTKIMPINKKYPLARLFEALKKYSKTTNRNRMTFEYVMINDFNDTIDDAKRLVKLLSQLPSKVNLIPLNINEQGGDTSHLLYQRNFRPGGSVPSNANLFKLQTPAESTVQRFAQYLRNKHIQVNIRSSRGQDILAACGQLAGKK